MRAGLPELPPWEPEDTEEPEVEATDQQEQQLQQLQQQQLQQLQQQLPPHLQGNTQGQCLSRKAPLPFKCTVYAGWVVLSSCKHL